MNRSALVYFLCFPLFAAFLPAAPQSADDSQSRESYAVYSVLIPQVQSVEQPKFLVASETVAYESTKSRFPVEPEKLLTKEEFHRQLDLSKGTPEWDKIWRSRPCILVPKAEQAAYSSAMQDYRHKNETSVALERRLDLPKPYELVNVSELPREKRVEFAGKNGAYGIYEVSAVGFSQDMTVAIVYIGFDCPRCSRWALHVLRRTEGKWKEVAEGCGSMS